MKSYGILDHTVEHFRNEPKYVLEMIEKMKQEIKESKTQEAIESNTMVLRQWEYIAHRIDAKERARERFVFR